MMSRSRALALLLLLAVCMSVLAALAVPALMRWRAAGETIVEARAKLAKASAQDGASSALAASQTEWLRFSNTPQGGFLLGDTAEDAELAARKTVEQALDEAARNLTLNFGERQSIRGRGQSLPVTIEVEIPEDSLPGTLIALESEPPFLIVRSLTLSTGEKEAAAKLSLEGAFYWLGGGM